MDDARWWWSTELHLWLKPYTNGEHHLFMMREILLTKPTYTLAWPGGVFPPYLSTTMRIVISHWPPIWPWEHTTYTCSIAFCWQIGPVKWGRTVWRYPQKRSSSLSFPLYFFSFCHRMCGSDYVIIVMVSKYLWTMCVSRMLLGIISWRQSCKKVGVSCNSFQLTNKATLIKNQLRFWSQLPTTFWTQI